MKKVKFSLFMFYAQVFFNILVMTLLYWNTSHTFLEYSIAGTTIMAISYLTTIFQLKDTVREKMKNIFKSLFFLVIAGCSLLQILLAGNIWGIFDMTDININLPIYFDILFPIILGSSGIYFLVFSFNKINNIFENN